MVHHTLIVSSQVMSTMYESILPKLKEVKFKPSSLVQWNILKSTRLNELTEVLIAVEFVHTFMSFSGSIISTMVPLNLLTYNFFSFGYSDLWSISLKLPTLSSGSALMLTYSSSSSSSFYLLNISSLASPSRACYHAEVVMCLARLVTQNLFL